MENYTDFLPFSEEVQQAFENYNVEASTLTIKALPKGGYGSIIGRVVWRSPLVKIGGKKSVDAVHMTVMDADKHEITGTAWGAIALKFCEKLELGKIYKFSNVVTILQSVHQRAKNDHFESRVLNQTYEMRFSSVIEPEEVHQDPFPDLDQSQFRNDYLRFRVGEVTALVGIVVGYFSKDGLEYLCLSTGTGECVVVSFEQEKLEELKTMKIFPRHTVLGILGVGKVRDIDTKTTGNNLPKALFRTFNDSVFIIEPKCAATDHLVTWRNEYPMPEAELQFGKQVDQ